METAWHLLENDILDPMRLACDVDVVFAVAYTRPNDRCSKMPKWPDGVDDDSRMLHDCVHVIGVCNVRYKQGNVREVTQLVDESLEFRVRTGS